MDDAANITDIIQGLRSEFMTSERIEAMFNRQQQQNEAIKEQLEAMAVSHASLSQEINRLSVPVAQVVNLVRDQQELRQQDRESVQQLSRKVDSLDRSVDTLRAESVKHAGQIENIERDLHGSATHTSNAPTVFGMLGEMQSTLKAMQTAQQIDRQQTDKKLGETRDYVDETIRPVRDEIKVILEYIDILMSPIRAFKWIVGLLTPRQWKALAGFLIVLFITSFCTTNPEVQSALDVFLGSLAIGG